MFLGFAATGPETFAGNYGLWDLRRALLWIRKNAKALNIDPKRITVGGYSAGSAAVGALTLSEHTRGLHSFLGIFKKKKVFEGLNIKCFGNFTR